MTYTSCKASDCIAVKLPFLSDIPISPWGVKLLDKKCVFTVPDVSARRLYRSPVRKEEEEEEDEEEEEEGNEQMESTPHNCYDVIWCHMMSYDVITNQLIMIWCPYDHMLYTAIVMIIIVSS